MEKASQQVLAWCPTVQRPGGFRGREAPSGDPHPHPRLLGVPVWASLPAQAAHSRLLGTLVCRASETRGVIGRGLQVGDLELREPSGSASTDRRGERVGEEPRTRWNAEEEPWEGAPRTGAGGQGRWTGGLQVCERWHHHGPRTETSVGISTLQGAQWSGPKGPEAGTAKRRCFYEKERKRPDRCRGSLLRRRPDLAQDAETCLGGRVVTKSLKPVQKCVAGTGELYYQSQHMLRRKKIFFSIFWYF